MTEKRVIEIIKKTAFFITIFLFAFMFMTVEGGPDMESDTDLDLWHRMAVGRIFSQLGMIIHNDIFSYFPSKDLWVDHEWLSGVIFYYLGHFWGDYGILTLQILITFSILVLIYKTNKLILPENKYRISYYIIALIAIQPGLVSSIRCQSFTYLFFVLWLFLLERIRRGESRFIWIFPATMLLWVNMHGGFLAGIGLVGFYLVGDFLNTKNGSGAFSSDKTISDVKQQQSFQRLHKKGDDYHQKNISKYFLILALILPVTLINPYGFKYWVYMIDAVSMSRPYISEWQAFNPLESFYKGLGFKILFLIVFVGFGYKLFSENNMAKAEKFKTKIINLFSKLDKVEIIALLATFYLAIKHERHQIFFAIVAACYGYQYFVIFLDAVFNKIRQKMPDFLSEDIKDKLYFAKDFSIYFFLALTAVYVISTTPILMRMGYYPVKAIEFLRINNISGNLFVPFNWSSYALWKLFPQNLVSIDGRFEESYKTQSYLDVCSFTLLEEGKWQKVLDKYHHDIFVLEKETTAYEKMKTLAGWKLVYEGEKAGVFLRSSDERKDWILPVDDMNYYVQTKYENRIDFD